MGSSWAHTKARYTDRSVGPPWHMARPQEKVKVKKRFRFLRRMVPQLEKNALDGLLKLKNVIV